MSLSFEFATATRIIFGEGTVKQVAPAAQKWGSRILAVTGSYFGQADRLLGMFVNSGVRGAAFAVEGEPTVDLIARGVQQAREKNCDVVVAMGGGSVMDAGKAIAALLTNPGEVMDYLEVVGKGQALQNPAAPFIAVPTTAGTGAEVTRNAVLGVPAQVVEQNVAAGFSPAPSNAGLKPGATSGGGESKPGATNGIKASLRSPFLLPRLAIVDPELTLSLPPAITASTGLDALTQLIEAYFSARSNPVTDGFCTQGIPLAARSLRRAFHQGTNAEARRDMSLAALFSGLALANAGLGVIHGFAAPIGGRFPAPHGAVCAAILPHGMEMNLRALRARAPQSNVLRRYQDIARMLTGQPSASAEDGIQWVREICTELEIQPLKNYGIGEEHVPDLVAEAARASSMKANPIVLMPEELHEVLTRSVGDG